MNPHRLAPVRTAALASSLLVLAAVSPAQVPLADQPVFSALNVPGNLALALSVEFPTAISVAHPPPSRSSSRSNYSVANTYIGYFDPNKCYAYRYTDGTSVDNYFYPVGKATNRACSGQWSGNYLNWASMQTIDPFRWALTGGYRVIDTASLTVLEKAWGSSQGSLDNFPDSTVSPKATVAGATPFSSAEGIATRIWSLGNKMRFMTSATRTPAPNYGDAATHYNPAVAYQHGTLYEVFIRVKVCDPAIAGLGLNGLESNCEAYSNGNYKPTGLMQKYADKIRYSAFGYLNDPVQNDANLKRDGGVLRARQKFIGPTIPVPGGLPISNARAEWDASTGVMLTNPDPADAVAFGAAVDNSGVMNYLNKFGQITRSKYKVYDPVGELYYAVQRYLRNRGNVRAWSDPGAANAATRATLADGFPVITTWDDPIQYSCQRNFILGIGDVNTHADRNLPGTTGASEPAKPSEVATDTDMVAGNQNGAGVWTDRVGVLQGLGSSLSTTPYGYNNSGALMAGLAYWANVSDIRPDLPGKQTIQTYWLDVLEYATYKPNNQFYLATKYGGFTPPDSYDPNTATAAQFSNNSSWWSTTNDMVGDQRRPDNYYTASRADQMVDGLTKTFASIASKLNAFSTSFSTALPQVSALGVAVYATKFDAKDWTGELVASSTKFDADTGKPAQEMKWEFSKKLETQAAGTGWNTGRNIVTYNTSTKTGVPFRSGSIAADQLNALDTDYRSGDDKLDYLNYLRGDRTNELTKAYRARALLLGDIVNSKARPVGPPAAPYSNVSNPGYDKFKADYKDRKTMVYVGANDGMLHAVDGSLSGATAGREVWAYIPGVLFKGPTNTPNSNGLAALGNPNFVHRYFVDASPLSIDVDLGRTQGGTGTDWRTLLVGGLGKGGKAVYGLDVTDPTSVTNEATAAQKVLWEFTDASLGFTYAQPVVVKTRKYGWVVVVGSGYNNADGKGYFIFINPRNGQLLEKVAAPCDAAVCTPTKQAGLAHVNAFVLDLTDGYADAIYGGDLMGNLWRLDVSGTPASYPEPVKLATLTGSNGKALPITSKPLPIVQPGTNRRFITVGTGRLLDGSDISDGQAQRFFAIIDGDNAAYTKLDSSGNIVGTTGVKLPLTVANMRQLTDLNQKITLDLRTQRGWYIDLGVSAGGSGWRVLSDPASFYGTVAFAATAPSTNDVCAPGGTSRVFAVDLGSGYCALTEGGNGCYVSTNSVVIDLNFYSVSSKSRLIAGCTGSDCGCEGADCKNVRVVGTRTPSALGLQRLNWREIIINN